MENYWKLVTRSPITSSYLFVDCDEYLADQLFIKYKVPVKFKREFYGKKGTRYIIVICKIRKRYEEGFKKAMDDMEDKMILRGYPDYEDFCKALLTKITAAQCELAVAGQQAVSGV